MAREVVTHIWCDVCLQEDDQHVEAVETPPITVGTMKPRVLALCERHTKEVYEPFKELVTDLGVVAHDTTASAAPRRSPGTSPGSGIFPCPVPECEKQTHPFKHEQSLRNHSKQVHGVPINELREAYPDGPEPTLFAAAEESGAPKVREVTCGFEGCDVTYSWPTHRLPAQAMGVHRSKKHGVKGEKHQRREVAGA